MLAKPTVKLTGQFPPPGDKRVGRLWGQQETVRRYGADGPMPFRISTTGYLKSTSAIGRASPAGGRARHSVRAMELSDVPDPVGNRRRAEDCPPYLTRSAELQFGPLRTSKGTPRCQTSWLIWRIEITSPYGGGYGLERLPWRLFAPFADQQDTNRSGGRRRSSSGCPWR